MPELPEVEFARKLLERVAVGRRVKRVVCNKDEIVYVDSPARVRRALIGANVTAAIRRGKYLWLELEGRPSPLFHFGMTGAFRTADDVPLKLASSAKREPAVWPPRFTKIHIWLDDGGEVVMTNARRLGRIRLQADPTAEAPVSRLGFDPLLDLPTQKQFAELVGRRSITLKGLLLNQSFAAGVGNWIADEVLYQARLDPRRRANELTPTEISALRTKLRHVITRAVAVDARKDKFPRAWLFHRRWGKTQGARTVDGHVIEHLDIAGRTTAWVPAVQR